MKDGFGQGVLAGMVASGVVALVAVNVAPYVEDQRDRRLADEQPATSEPAPTAAPAPRTVTETVEVEVPVLSTECRTYFDLTNDMVDQVYAYEAAIAPQLGVVYDTLGAIIAKDINGLNESITAQTTIQNESTGPLQAITGNKPDLTEARAECLATLEE